MWILLFSSVTDESSRRCVSDKAVLRAIEAGVKEINLGIIFPPLAVTLIMALLVPLGPATLTRPVGNDLTVVPDSGEDGGVRVCGGVWLEAPSATLTVNCSPRLAVGETRLLFSTLTVGEKGGVSPSREWMLDVDELDERRPGDE